MKYKSIFASAFLIIPFLTSSSSAEIFELVNDYDITAGDIESADFNNDGLEDFAVADWIIDSSYYEVFLSNGDCSFTRLGPVYVDTSYFAQLLTGDFNEDSNEDMLLMSLEKTWFLAGDGTGVFTLEEIFPWSYCSGCTRDVNNDDHLDLIGIPIDSWGLWEAYGDAIVVMLGDGAGGFTEGWVYDSLIYGNYYSCQLACFDNPDTDVILDMCVPCFGGFLVFQGVGDGAFYDPDYYVVEDSGSDYVYQQYCTCGDYDEDNYTDITVAGSASMGCYSTYVFLNQQDGTFEQYWPGYGYFSDACDVEKITTADLDLDGHLDLSLAYGGGASIAGYGDGTFNGDWTEILSDKPWVNFVFIDMDLDGDLDLADKGGRIFRNITINLGIEGHESDPISDLILEVSPNPFFELVTIQVSGYSSTSGYLQIFDVSGRLVVELKPVSSEGGIVFQWNGVSSSGVEFPSGIYTARLYSGNTVVNTLLLKLK